MNEQEKNGLSIDETETNENEIKTDAEPVVLTTDGSEVSEITETKKKNSPIRSAYEYVETFCYALALMMMLFLFVFRYVAVEGHSMDTTLNHEDKLIISDLFYKPKTGDIVVLNPESHGDRNEPIIKRVIATEGQTVYIDYANWEVYVDGQKLDEPYIQEAKEETLKMFGEGTIMRLSDEMKYNSEFVVGDGKIFVMGDNRNNSKDSRAREYGEIGENRILGKVIIRLAPDFGFIN